MTLLDGNPKSNLTNGSMDRNKAVFKLKGIPPVYVINLDDKPDRWKFMEDQFKYWEVKSMNASLHMMVEVIMILVRFLKVNIQIK